MAYDRYDPRHGGPDEERGWRGERDGRGSNARRNDRGFFERAGEQISSWFGDDDRDEGYGGERGRERGSWSHERSHDHDDHRERDQQRGGGYYGSQGNDRGPPQREFGHRDAGQQDYRPFAGDYARSESYSDRGREHLSPLPRGHDRGRHHDPHYHDWRERQIADLDRDYEEYHRENQSRFEQEFTSWREQRQQKRSHLRNIREHMEVVGSDDQHVGTVDKVAGDRIILTKSDPQAGGAHHSLSCTEIARVEGERVILDVSADQAKQRWRDEDRGRALFEKQDQGEAGPHILDESFGGTYRK